MMNPISGYNTYTPYNMSPVSAVSGYRNVSSVTPANEVQKAIKNPNESTVKSAGRKSSPAECETCASRKYQDGSNENVSFKTAQHISPESSASRVRAHEQEHVNNAYTKAAKNNGKVLSANVAIHTAICPECGRSYVSGVEERQVEITSEAHFQGKVKPPCEQRPLLLHREVEHRSHASHHIGAVVIESLCGILHVYGHGHVGRLDILLLHHPTLLLAEIHHLVAKMHRRHYSQGQLLGEPQFAQHAYRESGRIGGHVGKPPLLGSTLRGMYIGIIGKFEVLHMQPEQESIVPSAHINVGAVLYLALLSKGSLRHQGHHYECHRAAYPHSYAAYSRVHT